MNKRVRTILWHVARLAVMAALVAWVVSRAEWNDTVRDGTHVAGIKTIALRLAHEWWWVAAALAVMTLQSPVGAVRWRLLLKVQGIHITLPESLRLTYIGWFFNNWMPGATGGDFVKAWYIARQTHRKPEAVTVVFLDRFIGMVAMALLGAVAAAASLGDAHVRTAQVLVAAFLVAAAAGCGLFYSRHVRRALRVDALVSRLPVRNIVARVDRALFIYRGHKGTVAAAMAYSWVAQAVSVFCMYFLALGLGAGAGLAHYFVNMPVVWVGWSLVPVPGGFGVAEGLVQQLFSAPVLGVQTKAEAATLALAMVLAYRIVQMAVSLPGAVLYLARRTDISPRSMREAIEAADLAQTGPATSHDAGDCDA